MIAIVDCNSFYCSCERVFYPAIAHKPVVVLSNNDGCIISRTDEAKALGVGMAVPFFESKRIIEQNNVNVFSSNYHLYGDMSWRVMETLRCMAGVHNVEVYSVDEAFIDLQEIAPEAIPAFAKKLKTTVEQWTGVKVSVGVGPSKVLAKVANHLAKKNKQKTGCVVVLDNDKLLTAALQRTPVNELWGVGYRYATKLNAMNIATAYELSTVTEAWASKFLGGITGVRLLRELKGVPAIDLQEEHTSKKMIATTRMFGKPVHNLNDIKEAVATYTTRAAEKLRRQDSVAKTISVFVVPKEKRNSQQGYHRPSSKSLYINLPMATSLTHELIKPALQLAESLFEEGTSYLKAGIMLSGIYPNSQVQSNLFTPAPSKAMHTLMDMLDNVNFSMRDDVLKFAAAGTTKNWKMRQEYRSPRHTTRWGELRIVR
ncbi:MAG TPA: Y-family DNA polymerase [Phnomibacter sp.]|nr:Y-family DNA polymerase [Phnomibacter sp.]